MKKWIAGLVISLAVVAFSQIAVAETIEVEPFEVWGGGGGFVLFSYDVGQGMDRTPSGPSVTGGGYGFGYVTPDVRVGGFGFGTGVMETMDGDDFSVGFGGGGPFAGVEKRYGDWFTVSLDLGLAFGYIGMTRHYTGAEVKDLPDDGVDVVKNHGGFGIAPMGAAQFDFQVTQWMRAGVRTQLLVATDFGVDGVQLLAPGAGLVFTFGNLPPGMHQPKAAVAKKPVVVKDAADPKPALVIDTDGTPRFGAGDDVVIVVFSDFQCPYCSGADRSLREAVKLLGKDKASLYFKHFPLSFHKQARPAADAAAAAHAQGKFWEYTELLFDNQRALSHDDLLAYAKNGGLDYEQFKTDFESGKYAATVDADMAAAGKANVRGTPTIIVNGKQYRGSRDPAVMVETIKADYMD